MKRTIWYSALCLPAIAILCSAQTKSADAAPNRVQHTVIAASGGTAPVGGNYLPFSFFNYRMNARHEVAFDAVVGGPPFMAAIFTQEGKKTSPVALGTDLDPSGANLGFVMNPFLTSDGDVIFTADSGIFRNDGKTNAPLVRFGTPSPVGGAIASLLGGPVVNDRSAIAYVAAVSGAAASEAVIRTDGKQTATIARNDIAPPTGGVFTAFLGAFINDRGQVTFNSEMSSGAADHGVFRGEGGRLTPLFVTHQIAPGGGTFDDCDGFAINAQGQVLASCSLANTPSSRGLFLSDGTTPVALAVDGHPAPKGGDYENHGIIFVGVPRLNDQGEAAFVARLTGGAFGVFRSDGKHATALALTGTAAPGTAAKFESFGDAFELSDDGRVVFAARLADGAGVDSSNNLGIWIGTSEADLRLLVRTGDLINGKAVTDLPFSGFDERRRPLSLQDNRLLWKAGFADGPALIVSRIQNGDNSDNQDGEDQGKQ